MRCATPIPGFAPIREADVVLGAVRDLEPYQRTRLEASALRIVPGRLDPGALPQTELDALAGSVRRVYLHVDLDALDADVGRANPYAAPGGPGLDDLLRAIDAVGDRFPARRGRADRVRPARRPRRGGRRRRAADRAPHRRVRALTAP